MSAALQTCACLDGFKVGHNQCQHIPLSLPQRKRLCICGPSAYKAIPFGLRTQDPLHRLSACHSMQPARDGSLQPQQTPGRRVQPQGLAYNGVFALLLLNFALFVADKLLHVPWVAALYLHHSNPRWWQYLTAAFCHASWQHISGNAFMLLIFGRIVEEEEGTFGVLATYIFCALGEAVSRHPKQVVSLGASGAVFGLFVVSVLCKLSFNPRKLLECAILGQFVMQQVIHEAKMQIGTKGALIAGTRVGHLAHLFGALAGVLLVFLLSRIPAPSEE